MKLYDYYRSTCAYRVRIALNIKQIRYESIPIHLIQDGGKQHSTDYLALNPQALVPTLDENGHIVTQSLAIIDYLDEINPNPALLPTTPLMRSKTRSLALMIACDIHPLNNLRVLQQLKHQFSATEQQIQAWYHHWLATGFDAIETHLEHLPRNNPVCIGNDVSIADICLIPQVYNAKRFDFPMDNYPLIQSINDYCLKIPAFYQASPDY